MRKQKNPVLLFSSKIGPLLKIILYHLLLNVIRQVHEKFAPLDFVNNIPFTDLNLFCRYANCRALGFGGSRLLAIFTMFLKVFWGKKELGGGGSMSLKHLEQGCSCQAHVK